MPMSDEAHLPAAKPQRARKPAKKPGAQPRPRSKAMAAATAATIASPRAPVATVPEIATPAKSARRASPVRLGILSTSLAGMIGFLAWFNAPELSRTEPFRLAFGTPAPIAESDFDNPLTPHVRQTIEQELRLASMLLQIRESQESLSRLWDDTRTLAASVRSLASGVESLTDDVDGVRNNAARKLAQVEDRLQSIEVATAPQPIPLGDPALRQMTRLGDPVIAKVQEVLAQVDELGMPITTGGLPDGAAPPHATVKVSFAKKGHITAPKPIAGWQLHHVHDELALVEGHGAFYEVRTGEELPGAGIVRSIKKKGERWVVLTTKGAITETR
jgi:hypothetical protein